MPITPKPQPDQSADDEHEAAIQAVINKGLSAPGEHESIEEDKEKQVVIFVPESLLSEVDLLVKKVRPRTSRRSWMVEALREKVERDRDIE